MSFRRSGRDWNTTAQVNEVRSTLWNRSGGLLIRRFWVQVPGGAPQTPVLTVSRSWDVNRMAPSPRPVSISPVLDTKHDHLTWFFNYAVEHAVGPATRRPDTG